MVTSTKSKEGQDDLNKRLRSLKIDRGPAPSPAAGNRSPKLLLLGIAVLLALAALGYVFLFAGAKTISVAAVRVESAARRQVRVCCRRPVMWWPITRSPWARK